MIQRDNQEKRMENIPIQLDFRSGEPIYVQIVRQVEERVRSGELKTGDQLPTVRQLAADLRVNFNTVARSYRMLDEAGLISTQQGRGTYILSPPNAEFQQEMRRETLHNLAQRFLSEAARLGITPQELRAELDEQMQTWQPQNLPDNDNRTIQ
jgi:GntR family transcriptional regulator